MDVSQIKLWLNRGWIVCPACGSFFPGRSRLCSFCEDRVLPFVQPHVRNVNGLVVRSIFHWNPGESDRLSRLLISLKGPRQRAAWRFWAGHFLRAHADTIPIQPRLCVSGPTRAGTSKPDHSFYWGQTLSEDFGMTHIGQPFAKEGSSRKLGWEERWARAPLVRQQNFLLDKVETEADSQQRWVFADDIFTTGATARGIQRSLGYPEHFEVWVLAFRSRREHDLCST